MTFATLQGATGRELLLRHMELSAVDSVILVVRDDRGERCLIKSEAVFEVARYLGSPWKVLLISRIVPRLLRDAGYDLFAAVRYRLFGKYDACPLPPPELRTRFLD